jgi:hypothetical protein
VDFALLDIEPVVRPYVMIHLGGGASMSFDRIGPYKLNRGDLIAASVVISFVTGSKTTRLKAALFLLVGLLMIIRGLVVEEPQTAGFGVLFVLIIFVIAPALRFRKGGKDIYLESSPEGLVADTANMRTTYKWDTIGAVRKVGSRLFIMISDGWALVISDRLTSHENIANIMRTVALHQVSSEL